MIFSLIVALFISAIAGALIIHYNHLHERWSADHLSGPQKFHKHVAPRIGGVPIFIGWGLGLIAFYFKYGLDDAFILYVVSIPAFAFGLIEDITRKVKPVWRLLATFASAGLAFYFLDGHFVRTDIPYLDSLLTSSLVFSLLVTIFCVGGVAHSINIIDGYNGLSAMVSVLILMGLAYVAFKLGDNFILGSCFSLIGAIIGFFIWNYPRGLIFAGDGGAYLMGFAIAELSILLVNRHHEVSPWYPMLLVTYPAFETLFTIYRRKILQKKSVGHPDSLHLHQMIYKRIVRWMVGSKDSTHVVQRNAMTSPYLWALSLTTILPAMLFWKNSFVLVFLILIFFVCYIWLYRKLVKFKSPKNIIIKKGFRN